MHGILKLIAKRKIPENLMFSGEIVLCNIRFAYLLIHLTLLKISVFKDFVSYPCVTSKPRRVLLFYYNTIFVRTFTPLIMRTCLADRTGKSADSLKHFLSPTV